MDKDRNAVTQGITFSVNRSYAYFVKFIFSMFDKLYMEF